jgi:hypothetical protein
LKMELKARLLTLAAVIAVLAGLLVFSFGSPASTLGQETDANVGAGGEPPASLPSAGTGYDAQSTAVLLSTVAGAGVLLLGGGYVAKRMAHRSNRSDSR